MKEVIRPLIEDVLKNSSTPHVRACKLLTALNVSVKAVKELLQEYVLKRDSNKNCNYSEGE